MSFPSFKSLGIRKDGKDLRDKKFQHGVLPTHSTLRFGNTPPNPTPTNAASRVRRAVLTDSCIMLKKLLTNRNL